MLSAGMAFAQIDVDDDDDITDAHSPIQLYFQASLTDHVNIAITEDQIHRVLDLLDKYRKLHPAAGLTATLLFSGAVSDALAQRNSQTHLVDLVKDYVRRGVIEVGYDGTDEPTYKKRPTVLFKTDTPEARFEDRAAAAEKFLTEARDPITGAVQPGKTGGLKRMQEVFGEASCVTGITIGVPTVANVMPDLGSDTETVHQLRRYNKNAVMFGLPDENPLHSVMYRPWSAKFSMDLSPVQITPPELFWQDDVLRISEAVGVDNQLFLANNGAAAFSYVIKRLDRSRVRILQIELASELNYLTKPFREEYVYPPTRYAYGHPDHPRLPTEAMLAKPAIDAAFAKEDELLEWLIGDYLPEHQDSHIFSNASLKKMTPPESGFTIPMKVLQTAVKETLATWGDATAPPKFVNVRDIYFLSLAEWFQVMADALAEESHTGKLPATVSVSEVHGPLQVVADVPPVLGSVTVGNVAEAAAGLVGKLHDDAWRTVPDNVIPNRVKVAGLDLNPAQFLRLMAEALVASDSDAKLAIQPTDMFASQDFLGMRTRAARDMGVVWTYKPAALLVNASAEVRASVNP
jgi:hypothetical protein